MNYRKANVNNCAGKFFFVSGGMDELPSDIMSRQLSNIERGFDFF
jgi:hypothetical protein